MRPCLVGFVVSAFLFIFCVDPRSAFSQGYSSAAGSGVLGDGGRFMGSSPAVLDCTCVFGKKGEWGVCYVLDPSAQTPQLGFAIVILKQGLDFEKENFRYNFESLADHKTIELELDFSGDGDKKGLVATTHLSSDWNHELILQKNDEEQSRFNLKKGRFLVVDLSRQSAIQGDIPNFELPRTSMFGLVREPIGAAERNKIRKLIENSQRASKSESTKD